MGRTLKDITEMRFDRLKAVEYVKNDRHGTPMWLCECDCGNTKVVRVSSLFAGLTRSCGCLNREVTARRNGTLLAIGDETHPLSEWARIKGISYYALMKRIERGETPQAAINGLVAKAVKRNV